MDWENNLKSDPKNQKTVKIKVNCRMWTKKPLARERILVQTQVFSLYFKIREISRRKTTPFFAQLPVSVWPKSLLQFDFKNHENVRTDLKKKRQCHNTIQIV